MTAAAAVQVVVAQPVLPAHYMVSYQKEPFFWYNLLKCLKVYR